MHSHQGSERLRAQAGAACLTSKLYRGRHSSILQGFLCSLKSFLTPLGQGEHTSGRANLTLGNSLYQESAADH